MKNKPLMSICIPTLNRPKLLGELVERLIGQIGEHTDEIEIVISNNNKDGSDTDEVIIPYTKQYSNIHYFKHPEIVGFYNTIKTTEHAQGEYIVSLADDDCLTDFALGYIKEMIEKTQFDIMIHKPFFSEFVDIPVEKTHNEFKAFSGINDYISYLYHHEKQYKTLISFFSFSSALIVKAKYRHESLPHINETLIKGSNFPHEFPSYYNLKDKVIIIPKAAMVIGRILNESYPGTMKLVSDFQDVMDYIEIQNNLKGSKKWLEIKTICLHGWERTIRRGILIKKLGINYKKNVILKAVYYLYKRFIQ